MASFLSLHSEVSPAQEQRADEVLLLASQNDPRLFQILVERYQQPFLRTALRIVRRHEDAEDVVQEAFLKIYKNAHKFVKQENVQFKSWAYRVLINTSFTHYQKLKKRLEHDLSDGEEVVEMNVAAVERPDEHLHARLIIERVLTELPEDLALILKKHYIEDKAYTTIAAEGATTVTAIKMRLFRARKAAKKLFDGEESST